MLTTNLNGARTVSVTRCNFPDLADVLTGVHVTPINQARFEEKKREIDSAATYGISTSFGGTVGWYGGIANVAAAEALMRDGWLEGARQAEALTPTLTNIVPAPKMARRRVRWADDGSELSIDRALAGQWETAYRTRGTSLQTPRIVTLGCNFGGNGSVTHKALFWNAAQMIVVTDALEHAGYAVELRALKCNWVDSGRIFLDITVKRAGQPMRADVIAAVFGHAGVYRSFGHCMLFSSPLKVNDHLGSAGDVGATLRELVDEKLVDACDYVMEHAHSIGDATRNVTDTLLKMDGRVDA